MQSELRHLQRVVGITFILVTHDQEEALTMSDKVAVMFDGKVEQIASPRELYERPSSKRVASFIGTMNFILKTIFIQNIYDNIINKNSITFFFFYTFCFNIFYLQFLFVK